MEEAAERLDVSVSLATPDGEEIISFDTFRRARSETLMHIAPGVRIPIAYTALWMSSLAVLPAAERTLRIDHLLARHVGDAETLRKRIEDGLRQHAAHGWCQASWVADAVGVARALYLPGFPILSFNCAGSASQMTPIKIERKLVPLLRELTELVKLDGRIVQ